MSKQLSAAAFAWMLHDTLPYMCAHTHSHLKDHTTDLTEDLRETRGFHHDNSSSNFFLLCFPTLILFVNAEAWQSFVEL